MGALSEIKKLTSRLDAVTVEAAKTGLKKAFKVCAEEQHKMIRDTFNKSVTEFYNAYEPLEYERRGDTGDYTGGLYELLSLDNPASDGFFASFEDDYMDLYDEQKMHDGRNGNRSLFETVFVDGYHGGAKGIAEDKVDEWGAHPNPGTAYWRTEGYVKKYKRRYKYGKWGGRAYQTDSPRDIMIDEMNDIVEEMRDMVKRTVEEHVQAEIHEAASKKFPAILKELGW